MQPLNSPVAQSLSHGIAVETRMAFDDAERKVRELLKQEGFGVLTEIDVKDTLREKLGVEFRKYKILGACYPPLAYRALSIDPAVGLLLPCNVVIEEREVGTRVSFLDPIAALGVVGNRELEPMAADAAARLRRVAQGMAG